MDTRQILSDLRTERDRIDQAISALESLAGIASVPAKAAPSIARHGGARTMSADARRRISIRMKERWAERKAKG